MMASYPKDLTGLRFGRLVVLGKNPERYVSPKGKTESKWDCLCDCGNRVTITRSHLIKGISRSCGCYMRDKARSQAQDLTGMRFGHLTVIEKVTLDKPTDTGIITAWRCLCDCGNEKIFTTKRLKGEGVISCGCATKETIPKMHENLGRTENTTLANIKPGRGPNSNNKSGVLGVYYSNSDDCWVAQIGFQGKRIRLGRFRNFEDAVAARKAAEKEYWDPMREKHVDYFLDHPLKDNKKQ